MENLGGIEFSQNRPEAGRRRISILLTILALLLWSHSILFARFEIGYWGLINGVPITFFVGLALLTIASAILWVSKEKHGNLLCLQLVILFLALNLVPLITGGSAPFINHAYRNLGFVDYIVRQAHFETQFTFYLGWPGTFIPPAMVAKIGLIDFKTLIETLSLILPTLILLSLYVFLKNVLGENRSNYIWVGCWLFCLSSWGGGNLISAMGIAMLFLVVLLALVTNPRIWHKEGKSLVILSLIAIVFTAMVASHLLTSLAALGIMAALSIVRWDKRLALTTTVCLAILLAWNLTVAGDYVISRLPFISGREFIFDLSVLTEREVTGHFLGSSSHINVAITSIIHAGIFALIGLSGIISSLVMRKDLKTTFSLLAITAIPLPLVVLSGYYAKEILTRIYAFIIPGIAYFGAILFDANKRVVAIVLCLILIMVIPMKMIANYGNQELDYFSPAQRVGTFFFHDNTSQGLVFSSRPIGAVENIEKYIGSDLDNLRWRDNQWVEPKWLRAYSPYYISISRRDRAWYGWFLGKTLFIPELEQRLQDAVIWDFIYNNPDLKIYICEVDEANEGG